MTDDCPTLTPVPVLTCPFRAAKDTPLLGLVIAWSAAQPLRTGEVALIPSDGRPRVLGRGSRHANKEASHEGEPLQFYRQRPDILEPTEPLEGRGISRKQLRLTSLKEGLSVERIGRCPLRISGGPAECGIIQPGDTVLLEQQLLLLCVYRPPGMPGLRHYSADHLGPFGDADLDGLVGEGPAMFALRERLALSAQCSRHVLLLGASGTGKELLAQGLHRMSARAGRPLVSRNAATFPPGLIDAELFGNAKGYPNPGMVERPGLIGEAHGSTLFLDEIGELPAELQAHLLRVLDSGGEYQRLGEQRLRHSDLRLIGATNRRPGELKHDFLARFTLRLSVPGLMERQEDIPLLVRHLLRQACDQVPELGRRFLDRRMGEQGVARIDPRLLDRLLRHTYTTHVRELDALLWSAMTSSEGDELQMTDEVQAELSGQGPPVLPVDAAAIQASIDRHKGNLQRVWTELGLRNRYVLYRLIKKHGLQVHRPGKGEHVS